MIPEICVFIKSQNMLKSKINVYLIFKFQSMHFRCVQSSNNNGEKIWRIKMCMLFFICDDTLVKSLLEIIFLQELWC